MSGSHPGDTGSTPVGTTTYHSHLTSPRAPYTETWRVASTAPLPALQVGELPRRTVKVRHGPDRAMAI